MAATDFLIPQEQPQPQQQQQAKQQQQQQEQEPQRQEEEQKDLTTMEPTSEFSMLHLTTPNHSPPHPPCNTCGCHQQGFNPMKRRSPESQSESSRPKKLPCDQDSHTCAFSSLSLPLSLESLAVINGERSPLPVFRRCFSDPYTVPNAVTAPLPPRPPALKRSVSEPSSTSRKMNYHSNSNRNSNININNNNVDSDNITKEEIADLMRMRRMKDRLREMKKWWDEVLEEEEREDQIDEANKSTSVSNQVDESNEANKDIFDFHQADEGNNALSAAQADEGNNALSAAQADEGNNASSATQVDEGNYVMPVTQDDSGIEDGTEELVSVEWVDKSLCVSFKCPCSKGYQILLSGNKCYYKLV